MSLISRKDWSTLASSTASWQASSPTSGMREAAGPSGGSLRSTIRRRSNSTSSTTSFSFQRKVIPSLMLTRVRGMEDIRHGDQLMEWGSFQIGFYTPPAQVRWLSRPRRSARRQNDDYSGAEGKWDGGRRFQVALHQEGDPSEIGRYYRKNNLKYITYPYQYIS